jgi:hypothetical protein
VAADVRSRSDAAGLNYAVNKHKIRAPTDSRRLPRDRSSSGLTAVDRRARAALKVAAGEEDTYRRAGDAGFADLSDQVSGTDTGS